MDRIEVPGAAPFSYEAAFGKRLAELDERVRKFREAGELDVEGRRELSRFFKVRTIYNSNAIEGNSLDEGETRRVIEQGMTIAGHSMKDHLEAHNLSEALDYFEDLSLRIDPISEHDIRQIHSLILKGIDDRNAGSYRNSDVEITGSSVKPTPHMDVPQAMHEFGEWFQQVSIRNFNFSPVALATAAHAWFVQIHPFIDGNGRTARIILNLLLMRYHYPIPVITKDERQRYYNALEESQSSELTPFIDLVYDDICESMDIYEESAARISRTQDKLEKIAAPLVAPSDSSEAQEIAVFLAAMDLLASHFERTVNDLRSRGVQVYFKQFDNLTPEKYLQIKRGGRAKRTWAFRVDFRLRDRSARYLFWFWKTRREMEHKASGVSPVSVTISREHPPDAYNYVLLDEIGHAAKEGLPDIREISYDEQAERFVCRFAMDYVRQKQVSDIVTEFVQQVAQDLLRN